MKLTISPTIEVVTIENRPARVWVGTDENGTEVKLWVRAVQPQTDDGDLLAAFEAELQALPQLQVSVFDHRFVAD